MRRHVELRPEFGHHLVEVAKSGRPLPFDVGDAADAPAAARRPISFLSAANDCSLSSEILPMPRDGSFTMRKPTLSAGLTSRPQVRDHVAVFLSFVERQPAYDLIRNAVLDERALRGTA